MKEKKPKKNYNILKNVVLGLFFFFSLFSFWNKAEAYTNLTGATISSDGISSGNYTGISNCSTYGSYGFKIFYEDNSGNDTTINKSIGTICSTTNQNFEAWAGTYGNGKYYTILYPNSTDYNADNDTYFVNFTRTAGTWSVSSVEPSEPDINTTTRITWINPPKISPSATTTSRTIDFEFEYYLNTTTDPQTNNNNTKIALSLCPISYPDDECQIFTMEDEVIPNELTNISLSQTTNRDGYYLGLLYFWNGVSENTECPWWNFLCEETTIQTSHTNNNNFNVATTTIQADIVKQYACTQKKQLQHRIMQVSIITSLKIVKKWKNL